MEVEVGWLAIVSPAELNQVWSLTSVGGCNQNGSALCSEVGQLKQRTTTKWRKRTCVSEFLVCGSAAVSERRPPTWHSAESMSMLEQVVQLVLTSAKK